MNFREKYLKYKMKYLNLSSQYGGMEDGSTQILERYKRRIKKELLELDPTKSLQIIESKIDDLQIDQYFSFNYKSHTFHISFPDDYPFKPFKINGLKPINFNVSTKIKIF